MTIRVSRNWLESIGVTLFVVVLALAMGRALAQEPDGEQPMDAAAVTNRISYQGVLKESGQPVTGSRDMVYRLYSNNTCSTQLGGDISMPGVTVTDGLFNVVLAVNTAYFDGRGLWLEVEVEGTAIGCREILPAPYALSLRPGAEIDGAASGTGFGKAVLNIDNDVGITQDYPGVYVRAVTGSAVRGESGGIGIYGYSDDNYAVRGESANSTGGYFSSDNGVGIQAVTTGNKHYDHAGTFEASKGYGVYASSQHNYAIQAESDTRSAIRASARMGMGSLLPVPIVLESMARAVTAMAYMGSLTVR